MIDRKSIAGARKAEREWRCAKKGTTVLLPVFRNIPERITRPTTIITSDGSATSEWIFFRERHTATVGSILSEKKNSFSGERTIFIGEWNESITGRYDARRVYTNFYSNDRNTSVTSIVDKQPEGYYTFRFICSYSFPKTCQHMCLHLFRIDMFWTGSWKTYQSVKSAKSKLLLIFHTYCQLDCGGKKLYHLKKLDKFCQICDEMVCI